MSNKFRPVTLGLLAALLFWGSASASANSQCWDFSADPNLEPWANQDGSTQWHMALPQFVTIHEGGSIAIGFVVDDGDVGYWGHTTVLGPRSSAPGAWPTLSLNLYFMDRDGDPPGPNEYELSMAVPGVAGVHYRARFGVPYVARFTRAGALAVFELFDAVTQEHLFTDQLNHAWPGFDAFQFAYDYYTHVGLPKCEWIGDRIEFRVDRGTGHFLHGYVDSLCINPGNPPPQSLACHDFTDNDGGLTHFEYFSGYASAAVPVPPGVLQPGDELEFTFQVSSGAVPTNYGHGTSIGFSSATYGDFIGLGFTYNNYILYRLSFGANGASGAQYQASVGVTYRAHIYYDGVNAHLALYADGGVEPVYTSTLPYQPRYYDHFRLGIDYPGQAFCGPEHYAWDSDNGRIRFCVDRDTGAWLRGWIDDIKAPGCSPVPEEGPIAGTVTSSCGGVVPGIEVTVHAPGGPYQASTDADGRYSVEAVPFGPVAVSIAIPADMFTAEPIVAAFEHDASMAADFALVPYASLTGVLRGCEGPLAGVSVVAVDAALDLHAVVTEADGSFSFERLTPGMGNLSLTPPIGFCALDPPSASTAVLYECETESDLTLACLPISGDVRGMGYWKHQVSVHRTGRGNAQESAADVTVHFPQAIFEHFYWNGAAPIRLEGATHRNVDGPAPMDIAALFDTFWIRRSATMYERARMHTLALLLNVVSGKLGTQTVISEDGRTVSQGIQHIHNLLVDGAGAGDEWAKDIAEAINEGRMVPEGDIPDYGSIAYRPGQSGTAPANLAISAAPNPFRSSTLLRLALPEASSVSVEVWDVGGRRVSRLFDGQLPPGVHSVPWDGRDDSGRPAVSGVYYMKLTTDRESSTATLRRVR